MTFQDYLETCRSLIEPALTKALLKTVVSEKLREAMQYSLSAGGKRVRPALAFAASESIGGNKDSALPAAVALEMIHTYSLIHDDLPAMDNDDLRRGRPTNHKVYGDGLAILAGDGLLTEAFTVLSDPNWNIDAQRKIEIVRIIADGAGANGMVAGQVLDLENEGKDFNETILEKIHRHKTGKLLRASILAGGVAGGANEIQQRSLDRFATAIGLAFQIADDVLDLTATTEELGKDSKSDLKKKKATYPALLGIEESKRRAQALLQEALQAVDKFGTAADPLRTIAKFIVDRRS